MDGSLLLLLKLLDIVKPRNEFREAFRCVSGDVFTRTENPLLKELLDGQK
jgi:hypothetical protein